MNNDGYLDVVSGTGSDKLCVIYFNDAGNIKTSYDQSVTSDVQCNSITLGDADSDGD